MLTAAISSLQSKARVVSLWQACALWLAGGAFLVALNGFRNGPVIFADELGYLGTARYLAGIGPLPNMFTAGFSHFGYSLLITPAFWLGRDPVSAYRWALLINCLMVATVAPLSYIFARKAFAISHKTALLLVPLVMLYPSNAIQTNFAWSENALTPLLLAWAICLIGTTEHPTFRRLAGLSLLSVVLFFVHPRMLGIEIVTFAYLVAASWNRNATRSRYFAACTILVAAHLLVLYALSMVRHASYETSTSNVVYFMNILPKLPSLGFKISAAASGQILYLSYGSEGFIILGLLALMVIVARRHNEARKQGSLLLSALQNPLAFVLAGILSIFAASSIFSAGGSNVDQWLYGRYVDVTSPILLMTGILVARDVFYVRRLSPWLVMLIAFSITLWYSFASITSPDSISSANSPTLAPLLLALHGFANSKQIEFAIVFVLAIIPAMLFAAAGRRAFLPVIAIYVLGSILTIQDWPKFMFRNTAYPDSVREVNIELKENGLSDIAILVTRNALSNGTFKIMFYRMQYFVPKSRFVISDALQSSYCAVIAAMPADRIAEATSAPPVRLVDDIFFWIPKRQPGNSACNR